MPRVSAPERSSESTATKDKGVRHIGQHTDIEPTLHNCVVNHNSGILATKSAFEGLIRAERIKNMGHIVVGNKYLCRWCPLRHFHWPGRVLGHQRLHHVPLKRYVASGVRQLVIADALHDNDIFTRGMPHGSYLQRSAAVMRTMVKPWPPNTNIIRK